VTDRRNTENLLREKERQISTLMSNLSGMVYRCLNDKDWTMEFVSQGVFALTEYSPEEFLNKKVNFGDLILDEDQLKVWNDTQLAYKKNLPFQLTYRIRTKTGQIKWVWEQGRKVSTENNGTVLEGFITDITKPKLAEEAFEYERYLMQALLDNIPDSVYFKDLSSRFIRINQGMARKFGFQSVEEALGKTDADFFLEDIARDGLHEEQKIIQTGEPIIGAESLENWIDQRPPTWASSTKMPLRDKSGKITGTFGISRDITDRKSKEEEIKRLYSDLEKKVQARTKELSLRNQELEAFAYSISHDLKAPLRGINGYSQLLLQEHSNQLDEEGKLFLDKLILSSDQLTKLIDDLFSYTRLERRPINHIDFPVAEMIDAVIAERKSEIHKRGILLHQNVEDRIINSSPELFTQILRNCLDNAIKYTEKVEKPEIWVDFKNQANSSLLTIRDNGIGFDMKYAEKLFDVFYRLHRIDEYPGTGIGLALVKKAAELLGFRIWAEGAEGNGATFYLEIN
jgi:PAS domain S-box-containing protein